MLEIDGTQVEAELVISRLSRELVADLPDVIADLLEVVAFVYAADAAVSRGGSTAWQAGVEWRRQFALTIPVRKLDIWARPEIHEGLALALGFLSEDQYRFEFVAHDGRPVHQTIPFDFGPEEGWRADEVLLFQAVSTASPAPWRR